MPQIEVTFDIDANGILNVTAADKTTGKEEKITITNDKGRLSKEEIEKMVNDAEEYKKQDEDRIKVIEARNGLESYLYQTKSALTDEIKAKMSPEELETVENTLKNSLDWLDNHQNEDADSYTAKQGEVEGVIKPIITKLYENTQAEAGSAQGEMPTGASPQSAETVEEVD